MADLPVTPGNVYPVNAADPSIVSDKTAESTLTAGQYVYINTTTGQWIPADATIDLTGQQHGLCLTSGDANQIVSVVALSQSSPIIKFGGLVQGQYYYLSNTPGGGNLALWTDLGSTNYVTQVGQALNTSDMQIFRQFTGIQIA